mgnify:CR=1 FL=1
MTHVPPSLYSSAIPTFRPKFAASLDALTPPEPPPITNKSNFFLNISFESIVDEVHERLGKDKNYLLDSSNIRTKFNWSDNIRLKDGINETINWIDENYDQIFYLMILLKGFLRSWQGTLAYYYRLKQIHFLIYVELRTSKPPKLNLH